MSTGRGVVAGRTGVVLQNRGAYFSLDPEHPNRLEPGKRPLHTLIASLAFKGDRLWQVLGCMGADGQPQIHLQAYTAMIDWGLDIQEAVDAPRWLSGRFGLGEPRDLLNMEGRFPRGHAAELARRGHVINRWAAWNESAGHAHGITIDAGTGALAGGADPGATARRSATDAAGCGKRLICSLAPSAAAQRRESTLAGPSTPPRSWTLLEQPAGFRAGLTYEQPAGSASAAPRAVSARRSRGRAPGG